MSKLSSFHQADIPSLVATVARRWTRYLGYSTAWQRWLRKLLVAKSPSDSSVAVPCESQPYSRPGLSLLEVILALAILGVACTVMMNAMQVTVMNALKAQREAEAEICAESVLNQIVAGMIPVQPSSAWTPVSINASTSKWSYMVMQVNAEVQNMVGIQVMVRDTTNPNVNAPADFSVIRWIIDPSLGLDTPPATDETGQTDQSGTGQSGTGTGTGTSTTGGTSGKM